jgi:hypothetical protein
LVLILAIVVAVVGPQRVLAAVQSLLGYVPGMGFVDLEGARRLASPVTETREGVIFQLEQVVAQGDKTLITFSVQGMPEVDPQRPEQEVEIVVFDPVLRLPNGEVYRISALEYSADGGNRTGKIEFPPIPAEFNQAWLEFKYLPDVIPGSDPEDWQVSFTLFLAGGELPSVPPGSFVHSYFPGNARASTQGVTLQILQVAYTESETAVQLRTTWDNPDWEYETGVLAPVLKDDIGHIYREIAEGSENPSLAILPPPEAITTPGPTPHLDQTYVYPPLSATARRVTLSLPEMGFTVPTEASFQVDLGEKPPLGQTCRLTNGCK